MKTISKTSKLGMIALAMVAMVSCNNGNTADLQKQIDKLQAQVDANKAEKELEANNIALYDKMDLVAFSQHDMKTIAEIHSDNVEVINPDGSITKGMDKHKGEMQWLFDTFSDIDITDHPIKFGSGNWTAGMSVTSGTFDKPMKLQDGTVIPPTGKKFSIHICTLVRWENGKIAEEYLFWDNLDWNKQIGL
jgi:ketosteroid isomerase-like protein